MFPTEQQVCDLSPAFNNLKFINLRNCGFTEWPHVIQTARLWPFIESLGLQENQIAELSVVNTKEVFKNLK